MAAQVRSVINEVADLDRPSRQWRLNRPDSSAAALAALPDIAREQAAQWAGGLRAPVSVG